MPNATFKFTFLSLFLILLVVFSGSSAFADEIESSNFVIRGDTLSAGQSQSTAPGYLLQGDINPFSDLADSTSFRQELGYNPRLQAFVPNAPTLANTSTTYYDRLLLTIDATGNPTDALFAIQITDVDNSLTYYVQDDNTISTVLGIEDYQSYASWGGGSGFLILGLNQNVTYEARVKALHGDFTETRYGPASVQVATEVPFVNLSLSTNQAAFGTLSANSISTTSSVTLTVNTNAVSGYQTYVNGTGNGASGGLYDGSSSLIASADTVLSAGTEGYGAQGSSGTATIDAKYDLVGSTVGAIDTSTNAFSSNSVEVTGETTTIAFKVSISTLTSAGVYSDIVYYTITPTI